MQVKICTKCKKELPATTEYFIKQKGGKYGLTGSCRECRKNISKLYREKNPNLMKEYYKKNKEEMTKKQKEYYKAHREEYLERFKEYSKHYYKDNIEKIKTYREKWTKENPDYFKDYYEKHRISRYKYYLDNRDRILKTKMLWRNREDVKVRESLKQKERYKKEKHRNIRLVLNQKRRSLAKQYPLTVIEWESIKRKFGECCAYCGNKTKLTQDHIIPISKGGTYTKNNIVPACGKCNSSKNNKDLIDWYKQQEFYSFERLQSILRIQTEV